MIIQVGIVFEGDYKCMQETSKIYHIQILGITAALENMSCAYRCSNLGMECKSTFSNSDNYIGTVADEHSCKMIHNSSMYYAGVFQPSFDIFTNSCSFINIGITYNCEAQPPTQVRRICSCTPRGKFYLRYIF